MQPTDATQLPEHDTIFHLALPDDWARAFETGEYTMSTRGRTLDEEGFIHASTLEQMEATANRFYGDLDELVVLSIDPAEVGAEIRWEPPAPGVDELFPHIYGPLPLRAVVANRHWRRGVDAVGVRRWSLDEL